MSSSRLRLVAATTRTSTGMASVPPTGIASRSCNTRSSLTWVAGDISPISSRKNVPPRAAANSPCLSRTAPVNDPFTWPNSSDSSRLSGSAPQLSEKNPPSALAPTDLLLELLVLRLEEALLRRAPADRDQVVVRERLLDVVERALVHRLDRALKRRLRGHEDHGSLGVLLPHRGEDLGARDARHLDVREDDVGRASLQRLEPRLPALGRGDFEPFPLQQDPEHVQDPHLVVDDQNRWLLAHAA